MTYIMIMVMREYYLLDEERVVYAVMTYNSPRHRIIIIILYTYK